jgi:mercuric ion binding protein
MKIALILLSMVLSLSVFASKVEVDVTGMTCGMCVESITKELEATERVLNVSVSLETKKARFEEVKGKKVSDSEIRAAIKKAGYEATKISRKN